jgi:hypothetical protein
MRRQQDDTFAKRQGVVKLLPVIARELCIQKRVITSRPPKGHLVDELPRTEHSGT